MQELIRVEDVEKYYGRGKQVTKAVNRISFEIRKGEFTVHGASISLSRSYSFERFPEKWLLPSGKYKAAWVYSPSFEVMEILIPSFSHSFLHR